MVGNGEGLTRMGAEVVVEAALAACGRPAVGVEVRDLGSESSGSFAVCLWGFGREGVVPEGVPAEVLPPFAPSLVALLFSTPAVPATWPFCTASACSAARASRLLPSRAMAVLK